MSVASICHRQVVAIGPDCDLVEAAQMMRKHHVGFLIVVGGTSGPAARRPTGVLTDRDIVIEVVAQAADPRALTTGEAMSTAPLTVYERASISDALHHLREYGVRRAPVVNSEGELVGVIALDDILEHLAGELGQVAGAIRNEQRIEREVRT